MGFFARLKEGLHRTRVNLAGLFSGAVVDEDFFDELETSLIAADIGYEPTRLILQRLKDTVKLNGLKTPEEVRRALRDEIVRILLPAQKPLDVNRAKPFVMMMAGVNGAGKTTTIGKIAKWLASDNKTVLLAAADTFRAAAVEQLGIWAERTGSGFHSKGQDADPAAVAWEAMDVAIRDQYDILFIDTAGRLHTKSNLMDELHKIREVIARKHPGAPHRSILIVDATTGQNALQQTKIFKEAAGIDELILTKLDGTAKGGVAVAVSMQYGIPITYVGLGEKMEDLRPFNGDDFAKALLEQ